MKAAACAAACAVAAAMFAVSAAAAENPAVTKGREVFQYWCAACHGAGPTPARPGTQALQAKYNGAKPAMLESRTDLTPELTKFFVRNGINVMPPFRKTEITDAELNALAAYLARSKR